MTRPRRWERPCSHPNASAARRAEASSSAGAIECVTAGVGADVGAVEVETAEAAAASAAQQTAPPPACNSWFARSGSLAAPREAESPANEEPGVGQAKEIHY